MGTAGPATGGEGTGDAGGWRHNRADYSPRARYPRTAIARGIRDYSAGSGEFPRISWRTRAVATLCDRHLGDRVSAGVPGRRLVAEKRILEGCALGRRRVGARVPDR